MTRIPAVAFFLLLLPLAVSAQDRTENVTVTGQTSRARTQMLRDFIRSTVALSYVDRKLTRWYTPICPLVIGLKPEENAATAP